MTPSAPGHCGVSWVKESMAVRGFAAGVRDPGGVEDDASVDVLVRTATSTNFTPQAVSPVPSK